MLIIPAIDLQNREVVRLRQGEATTATSYSSNPVDVARAWAESGAPWIHVVDLDGAFAGEPQQMDVVSQIASSIDLPIQLGGGMRCEEDVRRAFDAGVARVVIGSIAATDPALTQRLIAAYGDRLAIAVDTRGNAVRISGWTASSSWTPLELIRQLADVGAARFIVTDVSRDGMLSGPNVELLAKVARLVDRPIIASGGIQSVENLRTLADTSVEAVIVGMALYEERFSLSDAIKAAKGT
ncbi:1-(5-phosphoribosyl)-5-[(5-phosphoribosylamino)methylideneamino]imidazole-4-carboxamide isomerase [Candidatus Bipolaricaulota bacterium]